MTPFFPSSLLTGLRSRSRFLPVKGSIFLTGFLSKIRRTELQPYDLQQLAGSLSAQRRSANLTKLYHLACLRARSHDSLFGERALPFPSSATLTPSGPRGAQCPSPLPHFPSITHTPRRTRGNCGKIVLIYPASGINPIISNNCHRQLGSQHADFVLIDFRTSSQLRMIWFPSDTMFIKGILHKGINRYCWSDLYEL